MNPRVMAFITVGSLGFAVQLVALWALTFGAGWSVAAATATAVEAAVLINFFCHERWTWRDRRSEENSRVGRLWRFHVATGLTSLVGNVVVTVVLVSGLGIPALAANVVAVVLSSAANYRAADRWVFNAPAPRASRLDDRRARRRDSRVARVDPPTFATSRSGLARVRAGPANGQ
jgi:putative flippase GtrA